MNTKQFKFKKTTFIILAFVFIITISTTIFSNTCIKISEYTINLTELSGSVRVVVISDLHGKKYGKNNS